MQEQRIPRRAVVATIVRLGYPEPSDDQIDRWDKAGLICEPPSSERRGAYGYTTQQRDRLVAISGIIARLESERVRGSEIAFWLSYGGARDVPADLVCEHIDTSVKVLQSGLLRILNGLGSRNEGFLLGVIGKAKKLGFMLARKVLLSALPYLSRSSLARETIGTLISLMLQTSSKPTTYGSVAREMRQTASALRTDSTPPPEHALRYLFETIADFSQLFRLDANNRMLQAVQEIVSEDPSEIYWAVELVAGMLPAAAKVFPWMVDATTLPQLSPKDQKALNRYFAPMQCAVMATLRRNPYSRALAADVSIGKTERVVADMQQMKALTDQIGMTISLERVLHD
jgi:hypothetical protein